MSAVPVARYRLKARLLLMRLGSANLVAATLCTLGTLALLWGIPQLRTALDHERRAIALLRKALPVATSAAPATARIPAEDNLAAFYDTLGDGRLAEQQVKNLFRIAAQSNLALQQAEYKAALDKDGHYRTYQITLPVKGPYPAIRRFCERTLYAMPFVSLDDVAFKREGIGSQALEATLRFTLYLSVTRPPTQPDARAAERTE